MALTFRKITTADAELLLQWRTDAEISKNMFTDLNEPTVAKQQAWIKSLSTRKDYQAFMICDDTNPVGFLCFNDIDYIHHRCSTGSYIYPREARLKYGATLHTYICNYVFHCLGLNKIVNYVMNANEKVLKIQLLHKTRLVGCLKQHIFKNGTWHDVHIFEQLKQDWTQQKQHYPLAQIKASFEGWNES